MSNWTDALGKFLAMDNQIKRHIVLVDQCYMSKCTGDIDHLLIHCSIARGLCSFVLQILGFSG